MATAGDPLRLGALLAALQVDEVRPIIENADAVLERAPTIIARFVLPRLESLPSEAVPVCRATALLGSGAELRHVAAVAELEPAAAAAAVDLLVASGLLAVARPLEFVEGFTDLLPTHVVIEDWRIEYNPFRRHRSLDRLTPAEYAPRWAPTATSDTHNNWANYRVPSMQAEPRGQVPKSWGLTPMPPLVVGGQH